MMAARPISVTASRGIFTTPARLGLKETSTHDASANERHQQDSLAKKKSRTGHWKPELASDSEEALRADRAATEGAAGGKVDEAMRILQEKTKSTAEETLKRGRYSVWLTRMHNPPTTKPPPNSSEFFGRR